VACRENQRGGVVAHRQADTAFTQVQR
jgi:hypothetical protein